MAHPLGWLPAAIAFAVIGWARHGPVVTLAAVAAGLGVERYAEWRARRREIRPGPPGR